MDTITVFLSNDVWFVGFTLFCVAATGIFIPCAIKSRHNTNRGRSGVTVKEAFVTWAVFTALGSVICFSILGYAYGERGIRAVSRIYGYTEMTGGNLKLSSCPDGYRRQKEKIQCLYDGNVIVVIGEYRGGSVHLRGGGKDVLAFQIEVGRGGNLVAGWKIDPAPKDILQDRLMMLAERLRKEGAFTAGEAEQVERLRQTNLAGEILAVKE